LTVPPVTRQPGVFPIGMGSPVTIDSSTALAPSWGITTAAEKVTVTNQQNGRVRRNGIERSFPERDPAPRGQA